MDSANRHSAVINLGISGVHDSEVEDLVVANGHVGNYKRRGQQQPYQMRPQLFRNTGGQFVEQSSTAGDYFQRQLLGRPLARLDFDRDGKEDFVVTHLDAPLALLHNRTQQTGNYLALRCQATVGNRDAVGAQVVVRVGDQRRYRTITAGDGYQSSNDKRLVLGLGKSTSVDSITVRWPGGGKSKFGPQQANRELLLIEGDDQPHIVAR